MILREIAITAPFRASSELSSIEYDSRVICALIVKSFRRRVRPAKFWKISIRINHTGERRRFEIVGGLLLAYRDLSIEEYLGLTLDAQREFLLDFIGVALREVFETFELRLNEVDNALLAVKRERFENRIVAKKWIASPNRKMRARIECVQKFREATISVIIEVDGKPTQHTQIAVERPDEFVFGVWFNRLEWINESQLRVCGAHGRDVDVHILQQ